jgi:glycerophosphoryl diester phosphodiesterase
MQGLGLPEPPWIVGHRGVRGVVPENTVASVREAVAQNADMVELDLQLTSDGVLIVFHDPTVPVSAAESRPVAGATLEEIRRWRSRGGGGGPGGGAEIPTLEEVLLAAPGDLPLNLEVKRYDPGVDPGPLIRTLARTLAGRQRVLVSSFDWAVLARVRRRLAEVAVAPLGGRAAAWDELIETARGLGAVSIHLHRQLAASLGRGGRLTKASGAELPVLAYTVNRGSEARQLLEYGVSGFVTDRPAALRGELEAAG